MWFPFSLPEPHDARARAEALKIPSAADRNSTSSASVATTSALPLGVAPPAGNADRRELFSTPRARKQFSFFAAGAAFFVLSTVITRRSIVRRVASIKPAGEFSPSNHVPEANGPFEAASALGLATLNVTSFAMMATGGAMWAMDISTLEDLRWKLRKAMDIEGVGKTPEQADDDIEEWMAVVMARMQGKSEVDIAEMMKQAAEKAESTSGRESR